MIILFDLDGTVLTFDDAPPGPGRTAMDRAMFELFGVDRASDGVRFAGGTDRAIVRALLGKCGLLGESDPHHERAIDAYLRHLEDELTRRRYRAVGDVRATVGRCHARGDCVGVATGNVRRGARIKLASAGLEGVFDLDRGGYGCDAEDRADILRAAVQRCAIGRTTRDEDVIVIGDTKNDVAAARAIGARIIGVAVNEQTKQELLEAGADTIVSDCGPAVADAIEGLA